MTVFQEDNVAGVSCVTITCSVAWASVGVTVRGLWAGSDVCHPIPPPESALFVHWGHRSDSFPEAPPLPGASYHLTSQPSGPHLSWVGFPFPLPRWGRALGMDPAWHGPSPAAGRGRQRVLEIAVPAQDTE